MGITACIDKNSQVWGNEQKRKRIKVGPQLSLILQTGPDGNTEYRLSNIGGSKPFAKFRAVATPKQKDKERGHWDLF